MIEGKGLKIALNSEGYLCDENLASAVEACLATRPTAGAFLFGPAGSGKTYLPEVLAKVVGGEHLFYQCFPGTREDDLLVKMLPSETAASGIALHDGVITQAVKLNNTGDGQKKTILVLDEWDKTRPSADSFLLDFLQTGRVNHNGHSGRADLSRLVIFVIMNNEREISEPLLRRLPLIQFSYLSPSLVRDALTLSHPSHPHISHAIVLYERCRMAGLSKPATIQELRQLLDSISTLKERADWNSLVFQFVTKTRENHALLKQVEGHKTRLQQEDREKLSVEAYESLPPPPVEESQPAKETRLPRIAEVRGIKSVSADAQPADLPDLSHSGGLIALTDDTYNSIVSFCELPTEDASDLEIAKISGRNIVFKNSFKLSEYMKFEDIKKGEGEIMFTHVFPLSYIKSLQKKNMKIIKFCKGEIVGKSDGIDFRAVLKTEENYDCEIIIDIAKYDNFIKMFSLKEGHTVEEILKPPPPPPPPTSLLFKKWGDNNVVLCDDLNAVIRIEKRQQDSAKNSDSVQVDACIFLPCNDQNTIDAALQFYSRVTIADENLSSAWGYKAEDKNWVKKGYRGKFKHCYALKFNSAAWEGWNWASAEVQKLVDALKTRKEVLKNA